ncbi:MAG: restriction endonuclease subunit S [Nanoarchaeota archaeon]|nr:restriction endonuclease subunit S [Nanoarchaeota archaeon]
MKTKWEIKKLGEVCNFQNGFAFKSSKYKKEGFPILRITNIQNDEIDTKNIVYINPEASNENLERYLVNQGDLLIAMSGATTGKIGFNNSGRKFYLNQRVGKFIPNNSLKLKFLYYFLYTKVEENLRISQGAAQPNLSTEQIKNFEIPLPPLPTQKQIVAILDKTFKEISKARENAENNLDNAKEIFESYLENVFSNPKGDWREKRLGDVCENVQYGTSAKSKKEGKIPVVGMGNIQEGRIVWKNLKYTDDEAKIKKYSLKYNDVLFNRTNSPELVGKSAIYKGEKPAIFAGYLIRLNRKEDLIDADFLIYFLNRQKTRKYGFSVMISSVNQANINGTKLRNYSINLPPISTQTQIVKKLDTLSKEIKELETIYNHKLKDLEELKKSILKKAFTGELTKE